MGLDIVKGQKMCIKIMSYLEYSFLSIFNDSKSGINTTKNARNLLNDQYFSELGLYIEGECYVTL
jgi:hypothetical protein